MSERGRELFKRFVAFTRKHPELWNDRVERVVDNLLTEADTEGVPYSEIEEEVGDLQSAILKAQMASSETKPAQRKSKKARKKLAKKAAKPARSKRSPKGQRRRGR